MTRGVTIFAFNNEQIDYLAMAAWSAQNIRRHLELPVCVITDVDDPERTKAFDQVVVTESPVTKQHRYFYDFKQAAAWHNMNRSSVHDLSPWDHTLVLDADYVVASDQLNVLFDTNQDFLAHDRAIDASGYPPFNDNNRFGSYKIPMAWATVMCFRKGKTAQLIFDTMQMIRDHWEHYKQIYFIPEQTFRNDYALSIAMNIVDGHTLSMPAIPWPLMSLTSHAQITQLESDTYRIDYENTNTNGKVKWILLQNQDFHAMGKRSLGAIVANNS